MAVISFNVVRKQEKDVKRGDLIYCPSKIYNIDHISHTTMMEEGTINPDGTVNVLERVSEPDPEPIPDTRIIPIDSVKHVITRKPSGGWGEPVVWEPSVGDEVTLKGLKVGDKVLISGVIQKIDDTGDFRIKYLDLDTEIDVYRWFGANDTVIYKGRSEE